MMSRRQEEASTGLWGKTGGDGDLQERTGSLSLINFHEGPMQPFMQPVGCLLLRWSLS